MKKCVLIFSFIIVLLIFMSSCSKNKKVSLEENVKPVKTLIVKEENSPIILKYIGIIGIDEMKNIAFKSGGEILDTYVDKGEKVKKGDVLAKLDTEDLKFALEASKASMEAAKAQYEKAINGAEEEDIKSIELKVEKAQDSYKFSLDNYEKIKKLYEEGAISKSESDEVKLKLDLSELELKESKEAEKKIKNGVREEEKKTLLYQYEQAKVDYESKKNLLEDAVLISDIDGYVVDVLYEKGEMVSEGLPVVIIRNEEQIVNVGLSEEDIYSVNIDNKAMVTIRDKKVVGKVKNIAKIPDDDTRTYDVEIGLEGSKFQIGAIVEVEIIIGEERGIWIPITSILSNGIDYVFVEKEGRAVKRTIDIQEVKGSKVKIEGIRDGDKLVVEGMKKLQRGDKLLDVN